MALDGATSGTQPLSLLVIKRAWFLYGYFWKKLNCNSLIPSAGMVEHSITLFFTCVNLAMDMFLFFYLPVHHRSLGTRAGQFFHLHPWKVKARERIKISYIETECWVNNLASSCLSAIWDVFRVHYLLISLISHVIYNFILIILVQYRVKYIAISNLPRWSIISCWGREASAFIIRNLKKLKRNYESQGMLPKIFTRISCLCHFEYTQWPSILHCAMC
mgnify:CR=1 FL=1